MSAYATITLLDGTTIRSINAWPHLRTPREIRGTSEAGHPTHNVIAVCGREVAITGGTQSLGLTRCPDCVAIVQAAKVGS